MAFSYFKDKSYNGQDFHIIRNGADFIISDLIEAPANSYVNYDFEHF
jgi:hypothetical protein